MRYSTEQIEFLMSTLAVFWFCLLWLSVMRRLAKHMDGWVQNLLIALPFLMSTLAVFWFCLLWLSVMRRLAKHLDWWVQISLIVLPFLLLIAVLVYYWRKFRE